MSIRPHFIPDPFREGVLLIVNPGEQSSPSGLRNVHEADSCRPGPCVVHWPTEHWLRGWPMVWRADQHRIDRVCQHGLGHPDPDEISLRVYSGIFVFHDCDGCCVAAELGVDVDNLRRS